VALSSALRSQPQASGPPTMASRLHQPLLTVVVPTFNEQDNVEPLVERVSEALAGVDIEMIFVDDSTDRTPQIVMGLETEFPVKLIHREAGQRAGGLTTAIVHGLRAARGVYVCVLDGDLQHPPEKLHAMLIEAQRTGADIVAASRYRPGGSASGLPGVTRRIVSVASKWLSKLLFYERLRDVSDPGSGFFLLRRQVIEGVELRPVGYKMLTEILVRGRWSRLAEVPYAFEARGAGASKAGLGQGWQYLHHTARIFAEVPEVARLWKFLMVGATGVGVNLGLLWLSVDIAGMHRYAGWMAGVEASVVSNFWLNRTFTWRDRQADGVAGTAAQAARYHIASLLGVAANFVVFFAGTALGAPTLAAGALGVAAGVATNFTGASQFVFGREQEAAMAAPALAPLRLLPAAEMTVEHPGSAGMEPAIEQGEAAA
jgi:dolichol-phosphate mannosyltransferase